MKKPRSDSKLEALNLDHQRQVVEWLLTPGLSYLTVRERVQKKFKLRVACSALSTFYARYASAYLIQRRGSILAVAGKLKDAITKRPGEFSEATIDALEQRAFELANNPMVDAKDIKAIFELLLKSKDQSLKQQDIEIKLKRLELLIKQSEKATETLGDKRLSAEQKAERLRKIFKK